MCLEKITKRYKPRDMRVHIGYKVFRVFSGRILGEYQNPEKERPRGRWIKEKNYRRIICSSKLFADTGEEYPKGWHIIRTKREAKRWSCYSWKKIFKVAYKNVIVAGVQEASAGVLGVKIVVAKEIKILEEVK